MGIPEQQLVTWSHQGAVTQSATTYQAVRTALESVNAAYQGRNYSIFLQGSYGNDTNIYAESDVDVVIQLHDTYYSDLSELSGPEKLAYEVAFVAADYSFSDFKKDVVIALYGKFGNDVTVGKRAIYIAANGNRRKSDVLVSAQYRRYHKFKNNYDSEYIEGICFFHANGTLIANFPKQHSENMTRKHQNIRSWLKPTVRMLKNIRSKLISENMLAADKAPSYYIEGLLYNVPDAKFGASFGDTFVNCINWVNSEADKSKLLCPNE